MYMRLFFVWKLRLEWLRDWRWSWCVLKEREKLYNKEFLVCVKPRKIWRRCHHLLLEHLNLY